MIRPSPEDLLGYVLGALDAAEQQQVQQWIDSNPQAEEELLAIKASIAPLEYVDSPAGAPPGLARRTCQAIAVVERSLPIGFDGDSRGNDGPRYELTQSVAQQALLKARNTGRSLLPGRWRSGDNRLMGVRRLSLVDLVFSCSAALVVGAVLMPALSVVRFNSRATYCQNNMMSIYKCLAIWADDHDGQYVSIPVGGRKGCAGILGPTLKDRFGLDDSTFGCPGTGADSKAVYIPSLAEIDAIECPRELEDCRRTWIGDFGYSLGHIEENRYCPPRCRGVLTNVIVADRPTCEGIGRMSRNHGSGFVNVLFEDGRVERLYKAIVAGDSIYMNEIGIVAPGTSPFDNVIGASNSPLTISVPVDRASE